MKNQEAFLRGYKRLTIPIIDSNGLSAWPELFPVERIDEMRQTVGPRHFQSQMMLDSESVERARLDAHAIRFYDDEFDVRAARLGETPLTGMAFYWDPSTARKKTDASVCVLMLRDDRARRAYIHECIYLTAADDDPHPLSTQCNAVLDFMNKYELKNIAVEVNGLGNAMPEIIRREAAARGQTINVQRVVNRENKEKRILDAIEPLIGTGRLFAHRRVQETGLMDEMDDWTPNGWTRDDGLDAIAGALRMTPIPLRPRQCIMRSIGAKIDFDPRTIV